MRQFAQPMLVAIPLLYVALSVPAPVPGQSLILENQDDLALSVVRAEVSPNGKLCAFVYPGKVTLLDVEDWFERLLLTQSWITAIAFSPESTRLAIASRVFPDGRQITPDDILQGRRGGPSPLLKTVAEIKIIDLSTGAVNKDIIETRLTSVSDLAFSSDGSLLAAATHYQDRLCRMFLWNVDANRLSELSDAKRAYLGASARFVPGGKEVLVRFSNRSHGTEIKLYETQTGSPVHRRKVPDSLFFSADGRMAAGVQLGSDGKSKITIYDFASGKVFRTLRGIKFSVRSIAFSANGSLVFGGERIEFPSYRPLLADMRAQRMDISASRTPVIQICDPNKGEPVKTISGAEEAAAVLLLPRRNAIAARIGLEWKLYGVPGGELVETHPALESPSLTASSGLRAARNLRTFSVHRVVSISLIQNKLLAGASDEGMAYFWNMETGKEIGRNRFASNVEKIAAADNGKTVAVQSGQEISIFVWDDSDHEKRIRLNPGVQVSALALSMEGERLAIGAVDGSLRIWDMARNAESLRWTGHQGAVRAIAFSPDASILASSGDDSKIRMWNPVTGAQVRVMEGAADKVNAIAVSRAGRVAMAGDQPQITLWDGDTGKPVKELTGHQGKVRALRFSPDGLLLVSGGDESLRVWDVRIGESIKVLIDRSRIQEPLAVPVTAVPVPYKADEIAIYSICFSAEGSVLACGGTNNTVIIWDTETWASKLFAPAAEK